MILVINLSGVDSVVCISCVNYCSVVCAIFKADFKNPEITPT